ncbi:hypothetical protein [Bradyrhizobium sp. CCBAU 53338]|uniref:hypothetical protein n=1 Tax=Bradyrhizobium sp. CCBAU 53338 TaxID=1325111 RepID=UPI00188B5A3C|nr:hypothetical protein [Bradyrhizobium sp. CCBAU 53338]QOZ51575.1 hypothetical protein XH90_09410 [Bradyrhizobium sp. CCBAU 53338]
MLRVTVELFPGGAADFRRTIAVMHIGNISDLANRSDYRVDISEGENPLTGNAPATRTVFVRDHDRRQSVWRLIGAALTEDERSG